MELCQLHSSTTNIKDFRITQKIFLTKFRTLCGGVKSYIHIIHDQIFWRKMQTGMKNSHQTLKFNHWRIREDASRQPKLQIWDTPNEEFISKTVIESSPSTTRIADKKTKQKNKNRAYSRPRRAFRHHPEEEQSQPHRKKTPPCMSRIASEPERPSSAVDGSSSTCYSSPWAIHRTPSLFGQVKPSQSPFKL